MKLKAFLSFLIFTIIKAFTPQHDMSGVHSNALIKLTAFLDNISGKVNGSVFARNAGGRYVRSKGNPVNRKTSLQMSVRAAFAAISSRWRTLSQESRNAWNNATSDFPYQNRLGDTQTLTGFALHQKTNTNLQLIGQALLDAPMSPVSVGAVVDLVQTRGTAPETAILVGAVEDTAAPGSILLIYATGPLSPGKDNFENKLRLIGTGDPGQLEEGLEVNDLYALKFPAPSATDIIGWKVVNIAIATGQASAAAYFKGPYTAAPEE